MKKNGPRRRFVPPASKEICRGRCDPLEGAEQATSLLGILTNVFLSTSTIYYRRNSHERAAVPVRFPVRVLRHDSPPAPLPAGCSPAPHRDKAHVHTYLAWVEPPGLSLPYSILRRAFDARLPLAEDFARWFIDLYQLTPRATPLP